jgi:unsaturated chondroitin disaccharide hydrolase
MNKNNKVKMIVALCLSCMLGTTHAQDSEKAFIKENMSFAAEQYRLMLKTPAQGKDGKGVMPQYEKGRNCV